jgi:hypothetical protein
VATEERNQGRRSRNETKKNRIRKKGKKAEKPRTIKYESTTTLTDSILEQDTTCLLVAWPKTKRKSLCCGGFAAKTARIMEYWHSACQSPVSGLTDSDRGRCSPILSSSGNISQENDGLNDWQLAPSVTAEVVLGSRGFYGRRSSEHLTKDGKHDDDVDSIVSSEENVASFASRFVALGFACTKSQLLCSY